MGEPRNQVRSLCIGFKQYNSNFFDTTFACYNAPTYFLGVSFKGNRLFRLERTGHGKTGGGRGRQAGLARLLHSGKTAERHVPRRSVCHGVAFSHRSVRCSLSPTSSDAAPCPPPALCEFSSTLCLLLKVDRSYRLNTRRRAMPRVPSSRVADAPPCLGKRYARR